LKAKDENGQSNSANLAKSDNDWAFTVTTTQVTSQYPNLHKGTKIDIYDLATCHLTDIDLPSSGKYHPNL